METRLTEGSAAVTTAATNAAGQLGDDGSGADADGGERTTITETWVGGMVTGIANQNPILTLGVQTLGDNVVTTATDTPRRTRARPLRTASWAVSARRSLWRGRS